MDIFGLPQMAALLILLQRALEELYSQHNTRRLLEQGAHQVGGDFYPVVAAVHLCWIAGLALLVPPDAPVHAPLLIAFVALQGLRYWIIATTRLLLDTSHYHSSRSAYCKRWPLPPSAPSQLCPNSGRDTALATCLRPTGSRRDFCRDVGRRPEA